MNSESNGPVSIYFDRLVAKNITLPDKSNFVFINQFAYGPLSITLNQFTLVNCSVDLGGFFKLLHSSQLFSLVNAVI